MSNYIIHNGELYHFGVKGMKWGVRRKKTAPNHKKLVVREYMKATKDARRVMKSKEAQQTLSDARRVMKSKISRGEKWLTNNHTLMGMSISQANHYAAMQAHRTATNAGLMSMSLGTSMGTNPFMFGMM